MSIKIKAKIIKEIFRNGDFRILSASPIGEDYKSVKLSGYGTFSLKGELPYLDVGTEYDLELEELETTKYGTAYKVLSVPSLTQIDLDKLSLDESKKILCTFTTDRQADNILKAYPNFISLVVNQGKDAIDTNNIKNVGEAYLSAYARELTSKYKYLHVLNKYKDYNVNITDCKALYGEFRDELGIDKGLKEKPYYSLIEVLDRSFDRADKLLRELREDLIESEQRAEFMVLDVLHRNENDGSTKLNAKDLWDYCHEYDNRLLPYVRKVCENSELIYFNSENNDVAIMSTYLGEVKVADFVKEKLSNNIELDIDWNKYKKIGEFEMSDMQMKGLENFCKYNISIIAGVAGGGKTVSVRNLIALMEDNHIDYTLLSSTGKASQVLSDSVNRPTSTVHRRCFQGDINSSAIIVDETTMLDLSAFCMLINAICNDNARIVLIGDNFQLPNCGVSKIFSDMIASDIVPKAELTEVFRYKSDGSLFVATNVRNGKSFFDDDMVKKDNNIYKINNNYKFIDTEDIFNTVIDEYMKLLNKGIKKTDILCLSPYNKGDCGSYVLNNYIQSEINPPIANEKILTRKVDGVEITFRTNDMVINTKNDYNMVSEEAYRKMKEDTILTEEDVADCMVFNGQIGIIRDVLKEGLIIQFGEDLIYYGKNKLKNLLLSYVISTHRSQGTSVPYSISIVSPKHKRMLNKELLYVSTTRCRKSHIDIGDIGTFEQSLNISSDEERRTFLKELLKGE